VGEIFLAMPVTRAHWKAGSALFFSFVVDAWEMMILILASDLIARDFHLDPERLGSLIGSIFLGMIPGCLAWGKICDSRGRKFTMVASLLSYGLVSLASAASPTYLVLWWTRFLSGAALSGVLVASFIYFEELLPVKSRGPATVCLAGGWPLGMLFALAATSMLRSAGWHWILAASSLAGLWAFVVWKWAPESPYWAVGTGRQQMAKESILELWDSYPQADLAAVDLVVDQYRTGSYLELFEKKLRAITILQSAVNFFFCWGYWALASWMPLLLSKRGLSTPEGDTFIALSAVMMVPGYVSASWLTRRAGRKKIMMVFVTCAAFCGFLFARSSTLTELYLWNFGLFFFNQGAWGVWDTWMGELYPTDVRGVGYSVGLTVQRVANALAPVAVGAMLARNTSFTLTVSSIAAFLVCTVILCMFLPETEGTVLH
jgi:putative MFS transporter